MVPAKEGTDTASPELGGQGTALSSPHKSPFLVVYDYGQGGVWAYVWANSEDEIREAYPELSVVNELPEWMADIPLRSYDIAQPRGLLADLVAARRAQ